MKGYNSSHYALNETLNARTSILVYANNPLYRHLLEINHNLLFVMIFPILHASMLKFSLLYASVMMFPIVYASVMMFPILFASVLMFPILYAYTDGLGFFVRRLYIFFCIADDRLDAMADHYTASPKLHDDEAGFHPCLRERRATW